ncbi:MAG: flagellar hook-associated protein FlgK [Phycisphaeraceae bacterium]|nr:flagellar hook-associated protein FlgK [Phycisphaeraceae bacterium]
MGLSSALQIGRSGLLASQTALEVTGQNISNLTTRGYHRQSAVLAASAAAATGANAFMGRGVQIIEILRHADDALASRLRSSVSDQARSSVQSEVLAQVQTLENALDDTGNNLSGQLDAFFAAWQSLQSNPQSAEYRHLVVLEGQNLALEARTLRSSLGQVQAQLGQQIDQAAVTVNDLLSQLGTLNQEIAVTQGSANPGGNGLRDQRDQVLGQLAEYLDISTVQRPNGAVDVYVGSQPLVLAGQSRGVTVERATVNGQLQLKLTITADQTQIQPNSGKLAGLVQGWNQDVGGAISTLDTLTRQVVLQVNKIHSQGKGLTGFTSVTGSYAVADAAAALGSQAAGLDFPPQNGSFRITVRQKSTGAETTQEIPVSLNGTAGDTTLSSLAASINAMPNVSASIGSDGRLTITAGGGDFEVYFSDDTSGILAGLGINTFFTGSSARDIQVNDLLVSDKNYLAAAGRDPVSGELSSNGNAQTMAALRGNPLSALGGDTLGSAWQRHVTEYGSRLDQAQQQLQADTLVQQNLEAQQSAISGVNADEEAINLMTFQTTYQANARFLNVVNSMMDTLLSLL